MKRINSRAFTLVEMMVAVTIGSAIIFITLGLMQTASEGFRSASRKVNTLEEARAAIGILAVDTATAHRKGLFEYSDGEEFELAFLAFKGLNEQAQHEANGDLCLVQYFTELNRETPASPLTRKLYRRVIGSSQVAGMLRDGRKVSAPEPDSSGDGVEAVAFNVIRLVVRPEIVIHSDDGISSRARWEHSSARAPDQLEVSLLVVDDETAKILRSPEDWNLQSTLAKQLVEDEKKGLSRRGREFFVTIPYGYSG